MLYRTTRGSNYLPMTRACVAPHAGTLRSVPRGDAVRRGSRPRGLLGTRGKAGLASTIGPVLVGVIFAFGWNMAASHGPAMPQPDPGLAPTVGTAVDQAADQVWASVTPTSTRSPDRRVPSPVGSRGPAGTACDRARSSGGTHAASAVDSDHMSTCFPPRRSPEVRKKASTSTIRQTAHRRSGYSGTLIVVVPTRGEPALSFIGHVDG
jgi:hypothetical protein